MLLLILESIGTSELILIGIVALIFLGPRKLPQIARTIGKTMADLRSTTNEFKQTWEREVDFETEAEALRTGDMPAHAPEPIPRTNNILAPAATPEKPTVSDVDPERIEAMMKDRKAAEPADAPDPEDLSDKRNWL